MRINYSIILVSDMDRSIAFYRDVIGMREVLPNDALDSTLDRALADGFAAARAAKAPAASGDSVLDRIGEITGGRHGVAAEG